MTVALVAGFMTLLDVSIVNVALPSIQSDLHLSPGELQWVLSGYALTFGLMLVPAGRFGDARGRRTVFIVGLAGFVLASAAAGFATSALWLVVARLVQGAAAGVVTPQVSGLIQQLFKPEERGKPFGLFGATVGVSTAVGPLLGGLLIQLLGASTGWRWIFFINLPIGIAAIILGRMWIPTPASDERKRNESLDPVGVVLLGLGVLLLLLPLVQEREWKSPAKWLLTVAAVLVLAGFVWWERRFAARGETPVVDLGLFKVHSYGLGALIGLLYFAGFTTIFFIYTLYLQSGLGYSALLAGVSLTPFAIGSAVSAALGGRIVNRFGRPLVVIGLSLVTVGLLAVLLALHFVPGHGAGWAAALPLLVAGAGSGLVISPNQTLTLAEVPVRRAGSAGAVLQTGQRIGTALGIAVVGSIFFNRLSSNGGHWSLAFRTALLVTIALVVVALVAALIDIRTERRDRARRPDHDREPASA
ncbi:MFS transporter [Symbioplanes lichenis]|uniref:MFS transporter n=1 Tax=Symbioplanes lichenis TaxID=1629072 RepID=UPI0027387179|nr:MFS transporter [Actinoplanes lichenis]